MSSLEPEGHAWAVGTQMVCPGFSGVPGKPVFSGEPAVHFLGLSRAGHCDICCFIYSPNGKHEFFQQQKLELKKKQQIFYQDL